MMENLTELYCLMDDFCKDFEPKMHEILLNNGSKRRRRSTQLSLAEMMNTGCFVSSTPIQPIQGILSLLCPFISQEGIS